MSIFIKAYDYEMRDVVLDGPYVPMKTKMGSEVLEPKLRSEWTELEVKKVQVNFKANVSNFENTRNTGSLCRFI